MSETIRGLIDATEQLEMDALSDAQLDEIVARGEFRPIEDEAIGFWFARFLSIRESLWSVIDGVNAILDSPGDLLQQEVELRFFLLGYAAACLLVRIDRFMLFSIANHSTIQRKLNEAFPEYRIPRKQYTQIFSAFVDQRNALALRDAMVYCERNRDALMRLESDPHVGFVARQLGELESSLNPSKRSYIKRAWSYVSHKWRRRGVVTATNVLATIAEAVGRTASEFVEMQNKAVTQDVLDTMGDFLRPGDVIVTRHAKALTNLFMPGFWPHAALFVGERQNRDRAHRVMESRKDGVRLRPLYDTLSVDAFVVLRPQMDKESIDRAIERAFSHEGKLYNFDFDFFNSDRVVCTELIYRSYDGVDDVQIPLHERAGRKVLSAEGLLDYALDTGAFMPVAIFGVEGCKDAVMFGDAVSCTLKASYRHELSSSNPPD